MAGVSVEGKPVLAGVLESGFAGFADGWVGAFVLVVRGHISDPFVESNRVVLLPDDGELGSQHRRVADRE